jgi:hypothetical protein
MQKRFLINPLGSISQCGSRQQFEALLSDVVDCFEYLLPALTCGNTEIFFDRLLEDKSVLTGEILSDSIYHLGGKRGPDLKRKWFLYTRNRAKKLPEEHCAATLSTGNCEPAQCISGKYPIDFTIGEYGLISFGGHPVLQSPTIKISCPPLPVFLNPNAWNMDSVVSLLPKYIPSQKHGTEPYFDHSRGEHVAPMQLPPEEAQTLLIESIKEGSDYFGFHKRTRRFYRFRLTGGNIYHGFQVEEHELQASTIKALTTR